MNLDIKIRYKEEFLPTKRHRIPRVREVDEIVTVDLREINKEDAPVAMVVSDYKSFLDENGNNQFGLVDVPFYVVDGQLYSEKRDMDGALDTGTCSLQEFLREAERHGDCYYSWTGKSKEEVLSSLKKFVDSHVMMDGMIYEKSNEPRYVVMTFGLGHNHGGTAMMITQMYNPNISKNNYFSALERNNAIAYADKIASARGDTKNVGTFDKDINIKVFMPEMVRCNPHLEHGDGSPLLNSMENIVQRSDSVIEAGLLVMRAAAQTSDNKISLSDQIHNMSTRTTKTDPSNKEMKKSSSIER